jgi:hypothetical protein
MKHLSDVLFESLLIEKLNLEDVPEETAIVNPKEYDGEPIYRRYEYFGDCKTPLIRIICGTLHKCQIG